VHPISYFQAIVLGLLQGVTEPFPVSSLGHAVVLPRLLGWDIHQNDDYFVTFLVATHLATAIVLFFMFLAEWRRILAGLWRSLRLREIAPGDVDARLGWLLVVGTIPAGILGLLLEHALRDLFASAISAAIFLMVNGVLLLIFERERRRAVARPAGLSFRQAAAVGTAQAAALVPGISRSGVTMGGGLLVGLSHEDAARYSFLLATPIIGAAALLKLPDLFGHKGDGVRGPALVAALCAAVATYFAVRFLLRYFETNKLSPFGYYCIGFGALCTVVFVAGG
jgi:undecaprenyl-diphosphatase